MMEFGSFELYVAALSELFEVCTRNGEPNTESSKKWHLLRGIPEGDGAGCWGIPINALRAPEKAALTFEEAVEYLRVHLSNHPTLPGGDSTCKFGKPRGGDQVLNAHEALDAKIKEMCRNWAAGKCNRGSSCKFEHTGEPPSMGGGNRNATFQGDCNKCGKHGHKASDCRQRDKLTCSFCGRDGHVEVKCYKKQEMRRKLEEEMAATNQQGAGTGMSFNGKRTEGEGAQMQSARGDTVKTAIVQDPADPFALDQDGLFAHWEFSFAAREEHDFHFECVQNKAMSDYYKDEHVPDEACMAN
jgi:hypothetical protein